MADTIKSTRENIRYCEQCFNISLTETCHICLDPSRQTDVLCIVASPKDIFAIEKTNEYNGRYHVLGGLISPLDGVYPESLRIPELMETIQKIIITK